MKNCFHPNKLILVAVITLGFALLYGCRQSDYNARTDTITLSKAAEYNQKQIIHNASAPEIRSQKKETELPRVDYRIVIPGRTTKSAEFIPGVHNSISMDGVALTLSAGSISQMEILSVTALLAEDLPPIPDEITNVTKGYYEGYRFLPHGMLFDSAVVITMSYNKSLIPEGYSAEDVYTYYYDENDNKWKALERDSINHELSLVVSGTLHFTDMINGIIQVPETPETQGYIPTSIKDINVADPNAGITLIEPPVASNDGDALLSFPINLPQGRAGMQPQLSLLYSSDASSGWTGYGWGLNIPSVSVDITWGVPRYLDLKESETYFFEGSQLTPVAHRGDYIDRTSEKRFYSRIEGDFSKIIRHGNNPANYWWEVTSKDGIRNFYGGLPDSGLVTSAVSRDTEGNIGYWALVKTIDLHDNFVRYKYDKPDGCGEQLYIREITYTGHGTEDGPYKITFIINDEGNTYERKDARINARYGFVQRDRESLRRINITINNDPVRSYTFQYKNGVFL